MTIRKVEIPLCRNHYDGRGTAAYFAEIKRRPEIDKLIKRLSLSKFTVKRSVDGLYWVLYASSDKLAFEMLKPHSILLFNDYTNCGLLISISVNIHMTTTVTIGTLEKANLFDMV